MGQSRAASPVMKAVVRCWLMISMALLILSVVLWDFRLGQQYDFLRADCLVAGVAAGVGATACLGGAMHFLDVALAGGVAWYWRILFKLNQRLLMLGQLLAIGIAVGAVGLAIFDKPIPGPDRTVLERYWIPPGDVPAY